MYGSRRVCDSVLAMVPWPQAEGGPGPLRRDPDTTVFLESPTVLSRRFWFSPVDAATRVHFLSWVLLGLASVISMLTHAPGPPKRKGRRCVIPG